MGGTGGEGRLMFAPVTSRTNKENFHSSAWNSIVDVLPRFSRPTLAFEILLVSGRF